MDAEIVKPEPVAEEPKQLARVPRLCYIGR